MIPNGLDISKVESRKPQYFVGGAEINHNMYVLSINIFYKNITP